MIDNDEFKIPIKYYAGPDNNVNLDWMNDKIGYEETAEEADSVYMKGKNDNELKLIKDFITKLIMVLSIIKINQEMNLEN